MKLSIYLSINGSLIRFHQFPLVHPPLQAPSSLRRPSAVAPQPSAVLLQEAIHRRLRASSDRRRGEARFVLIGGAILCDVPLAGIREHPFLQVCVQRGGYCWGERAGGEAAQQVSERGDEDWAHSGV